ncbi:phage tail tape measure protein [Halomonas janggokensis]|uniref:phage tail tape measure protein n=1 Tax=Vreelandella janggokensis TaxID=370767 RepID=UPI0022A7E511|nr:phage tail tape measure protein [Halomonas janggokensis]MCZ0930308.1 phage tail tape measure protein [Halomonas janggokensis]
MARDLKLQVILNAVDKATAPLKKIDRASQGASQAMRDNRYRLKKLQATQKDVSSFRTLKRQSGETATALRDQQDRIRRLSRQMQSHQGDTSALAAEKQKAITQARKLTRRYDDERQTLQRLRTSLENNGVSTHNLTRDQRRLASEMQQANQTVEEQRRKLSRLSEQQKRAAQARKRYDRSMGMRNNMAGTGAGMAASGGAALYAGSRLLAPGVEWGEQMSTLQAVGRFTANDERFQALRQQSRELGGSTAFSASEVGGGQEFLLRAGMSTEAIRASMRDVLDLALANNTELSRAADIASNIAGSFKVDMEAEGSMGRVADILSGTASRANVNLEMLGNTMKYLGGAEDLKLTMEQAAAMSGILGNIGIQGSQAGTTMRAMMNRLTDPAAKGAAAIEDIGLKVSDANGNMRAMPDILRDISQATADMGNVERKAIMQRIFGTEAGSGMAELVNAMGSGQLDEIINALGDNMGENARMAKTMTDNIGGDLKSLSSAWDEVGISITETNKGPLRELIQNVTAITRGVGNWINENPRLAGTLAKVAAGLAVLVTAGGMLTLMLASILGPIAMVRYGMALIGPQLLTAGKAMMWLGGVFRAVSMFFLTNPIGIAIAAIAAAAYLIYRYWEPIKAFFLGLWQQVKSAFADGIGGVAKLLMNWSPLGLLYKGMTTALSAMGVEIPEQFSSLGTAIVDGIIGGLTGKLGELRDRITGMAGSVRNWFANVLGINSPSRVFAELGGFTVDGLISGLSGKIGELRDRVVGIADSVKGWFADVLDINSPSRVFTQLGGYTVDGLNKGLDAQRDEPARRVQEIAKSVTRAGAGLALGAAALPAAAMPAIEQQAPIQFDTRPPLSAPSPQASGGLTMGDINITVTPAQGMNEQQLAQYVAQEVQRALANAQREAQARQRSSMRDID